MPAARHQANSHAKKWAAAVEALGAVEPWLAFRYLVAQGYNAHTPQGPAQTADRARAAKLGAQLVQMLGGNLYAPAPKGLDRDPAWQGFTHAVQTMGLEHQQAMLWTVWQARWGDPDKPAAEHRVKRDLMQALDLTLSAMRRQQQANSQGWIAGKGWPKRRTTTRS